MMTVTRSLCLLGFVIVCCAVSSAQTVTVFDRAGVQFSGPDSFVGDDVEVLKSGRLVEKTLMLPDFDAGSTLVANLNVWANDDPWDRAGSIRLTTGEGETVELHRFITGFGGTTSHSTDITSLAPLLDGEVTIQAFVDTWLPNSWEVDFAISATPAADDSTEWFANLVDGSTRWLATTFDEGPVRADTVVVPSGLEKVELRYIATGHSLSGSLGTRGDEFETREHSIVIDGVEVASFMPWRDDCRSFRDVNPTSGFWGNVYSSDFDRSGWCPGDDVEPMVFDVTEYMSPGEHEIEFLIDGIKPADDFGKGYWRVSSYLSGVASGETRSECDLNADGICDVGDLDELLYAGIGGTSETFDLDRSGTVDLLDRDQWLRSSAIDSSLGDFDFSGTVNAQDLNTVGLHWQSVGRTSYSQGDSNGDGLIDAKDLNAVGLNWHTGSDASALAPIQVSVPEPARGDIMLVCSLAAILSLNTTRK